MSQENVEIVRRVVDAIRDTRWEEAMLQLAPDIELHGTVGGLTEGSVWRGPEQVSKHDWVRDALGVPSGADDQAAGSRE